MASKYGPSIPVGALFAVVFVLYANECLGGRNIQMEIEGALRHVTIMSSPDAIPLPDSGPLTVYTSMYLTSIRDVDRKRNEVEISGWFSTMYQNPALSWEGVFPNLSEIRVPASRLWLPDIEPFNAVDTPKGTLINKANAVVTKSGNVTIIYVPANTIRFLCDDTLAFYHMTCTLKLRSWTYNGLQLNLVNSEDVIGGSGSDFSRFHSFPRTRVTRTSATRKARHFPCCPEPYASVEYTMKLEK